MVKVTLLILLLRFASETEQVPELSVWQFPLSEAPPLQVPLTLAPATGASLLLCRMIVTVLFQRPWLPVLVEPSRSPTCRLALAPGVAVGEGTAVGVAVLVGNEVGVAVGAVPPPAYTWNSRSQLRWLPLLQAVEFNRT